MPDFYAPNRFTMEQAGYNVEFIDIMANEELSFIQDPQIARQIFNDTRTPELIVVYPNEIGKVKDEYHIVQHAKRDNDLGGGIFAVSKSECENLYLQKLVQDGRLEPFDKGFSPGEFIDTAERLSTSRQNNKLEWVGSTDYKVIHGIMLDGDVGLAIGHNPEAVNPYGVWRVGAVGSAFATGEKLEGKNNYYWGNYFNSHNEAQDNFQSRLVEYIKDTNYSQVEYPTQRVIERNARIEAKFAEKKPPPDSPPETKTTPKPPQDGLSR